MYDHFGNDLDRMSMRVKMVPLVADLAVEPMCMAVSNDLVKDRALVSTILG